jgi:release factor glutamine methyltransferase
MTIDAAFREGVEAVGARDAKIFLSHATGCGTNGLFLNALKEISRDEYALYISFLERRRAGEPTQYIIGQWDFMGLTFFSDRRALIPRPETELLVDLAKQHKSKTVLDLCAGSGCVGISLAREIACKVIAVEKSDEAIGYLKQNIQLNQVKNLVKAVHEDIFDSDLSGECILINAPYLSASEMNNLQKEVTYEPYEALFGGSDGLMFYRKFFNVWAQRLRQANFVACEIGDSQSTAVQRMMDKIGLNPQIMQDYNGIDRVVYSVKT